MLNSITSACIFGCITLFLIRKGPLHEILRIAVGIIIVLSVILPLTANNGFLIKNRFLPEILIEADREVQEEIYERALVAETEGLIEAYFAEREMQVDTQVLLDNGSIEKVILYPQQAYEWTQRDSQVFAAWCGITEERQEWIWDH